MATRSRSGPPSPDEVGLTTTPARGLEALLCDLARPGRLFDLPLELPSQLAVPQVPAHGRGLRCLRGLGTAHPTEVVVLVPGSCLYKGIGTRFSSTIVVLVRAGPRRHVFRVAPR